MGTDLALSASPRTRRTQRHPAAAPYRAWPTRTIGRNIRGGGQGRRPDAEYHPPLPGDRGQLDARGRFFNRETPIVLASDETFTTPAATQPSPTVTGIAPNRGPPSGGSEVMIKGTNFGGERGQVWLERPRGQLHGQVGNGKSSPSPTVERRKRDRGAGQYPGRRDSGKPRGGLLRLRTGGHQGRTLLRSRGW
jgi:IPT/TIG domain